MTTPPDRLGTHDRRSFLCGARLQFCKSFLEFDRLHVIGITSKRGVAPPDVDRIGTRDTPATQGFKMAVIEFGPSKRSSQIGFVKLRIPARTRETPDVRNQFNPMTLENRDQFFDRARRMSNRPYLWRWHARNFNRKQADRKAPRPPQCELFA